MVCKLNRLAAGAGIALFVFALLAMTLQIAAAKSKKIQVPDYCQQIAQSDPRLRPLSGVCEFALSQSNLPKFVCNETIQLFVSDTLHSNWRKLDTLEAEVTFEHGKGERYAKVEVNNHPVRGLSGRYTPWEVLSFLDRRLGDWLDLGLFGGELLTVFAPSSKASFQYKDEITIAGDRLVPFDVQVNRKNNSTYFLASREGSLWPGFTGLLWVDKNTLLLRRMVLHATEIDPKFPIDAVTSSSNYDLVAIPELGQLLLPTSGESIACMSRQNQCWRNVVTFDNCHKFAGKARIVPAQ